MKINKRTKGEGKKFREYLLEGLMIFIAIGMGFIAENIREEISEGHRAEEYALSMINDLEQDTLSLKEYINYMTLASHNIDTLLSVISSNELNDAPSGKLYWYGLWGGAYRAFIPNDATFQQMKNSGSLTFFKGKDLLEKVARYDQLCRAARISQELDKSLYVEVRKSRAKIFEIKYNAEANELYQANKVLADRIKIDAFIESNPPLLTYDKTIFNEYLELVRSRNLSARVSFAARLLESATALMEELKKEYPAK